MRLEASVYANIVLAGGGAKGAVLGGCLKAVEDKGIHPVGFGGTSAGSIVAALASVGYSGGELEQILNNTPFTEFLEGRGERLENLKNVCARLSQHLRDGSCWSVFSMREAAQFFKVHYGLDGGLRLREFISNSIAKKLSVQPETAARLTFEELQSYGCKPLRVVATDLNRKRAVVFGSGRDGADQSVVDAVMASASFPFVFEPISLNGMLLVDGGLSSNLPSFLFEEEYRQTRTPTLAFDLLPPPRVQPLNNQAIDLGAFLQALLSSALEAGDVLLRQSTSGVTYFPIHTPDGVDTLNFSLTPAQRESCFSKGYAEAAALLEAHEPIKRTRMFGGELQKRLIVQFGPPRLYQPVLRALVQQIELASTGQLDGMRAHIMLLTGRASERAASTRIVTYSIGMEGDPDRDLELDQDGGCSGKAWETGKVAVADLEAASADPAPWRMTVDQHNKVPRRVKSMISVPIPGGVHAENAPDRPIGTLSVDCETPLADTGWCTTDQNEGIETQVAGDILTVMTAWATVVGAMLP
jgi:NTE family protein